MNYIYEFVVYLKNKGKYSIENYFGFIHVMLSSNIINVYNNQFLSETDNV